MLSGVVKWFDGVKGFGFIVQKDGGPDVFAHYTAINGAGYRELWAGQEVTFDVVRVPKGLQAENITPL
ncbi:cold-shock protein [Streptomyces sp. NPDC006529]|uniref:cold-shock protein n=1 Tax=Streptomyces sp. NPDC006529 TaxID=3157177 RepID=UPI0033B158ED